MTAVWEGGHGDIAWHYQGWRQARESGRLLRIAWESGPPARRCWPSPAGQCRDRTWTTDRSRAARRWGEIEPGLAAPLDPGLSALVYGVPAPWQVTVDPSPGCHVTETETGVAVAVTLSPGTVAVFDSGPLRWESSPQSHV